jgi:hypothetical protein
MRHGLLTMIVSFTAVTAGAAIARAGEIPVVEAKTLAKVPGPTLSGRDDPASTMGADRMDLRMRRSARSMGRAETSVVPSLPVAIHDRISAPDGRKAYQVTVPPGAKIHARLDSKHRGWFRVSTVNQWGRMEEGMLQNKIPTGNPEATFINSRKEAYTLYFVVDTAMVGVDDAYTLAIVSE